MSFWHWLHWDCSCNWSHLPHSSNLNAVNCADYVGLVGCAWGQGTRRLKRCAMSLQYNDFIVWLPLSLTTVSTTDKHLSVYSRKLYLSLLGNAQRQCLLNRRKWSAILLPLGWRLALIVAVLLLGNLCSQRDDTWHNGRQAIRVTFGFRQ